MSIISLSLQESLIQSVSGIPNTVLVTANIPCSIFYTLDGTEPGISSNIYLNAIKIPTNQNSVVLKLFATDGINSSAIITQVYRTEIYGERKALVEVLNATTELINPAAFGDNGLREPPIYGGPALHPVDSDAIPNATDGYDGTATGTKIGGTDLPLGDYQFTFSTSDYIGQRGHGIGTLPAQVTVRPPNPIPTSTNMNSRFFNPKALVIYQDSRETPFDENITQINKQYFSLQNPETTRDGLHFYNTGFDGQPISGSFLRAHHNAKDNIMTYYYFDSQALKWIISKEPYQPKATTVTNLANIMFSPRGPGAQFVFKWLPFRYRRLI